MRTHARRAGLALLLAVGGAAHPAAAQPARRSLDAIEASLRAEIAALPAEATIAGSVLRGLVVEGRPRFARTTIAAGRCAVAVVATEDIGPSFVVVSIMRGSRVVWQAQPSRTSLGPNRRPPVCTTRRESLRLRVEMVYSGRGRSGEHFERVSSRFAAAIVTTPAR
ncbi:MAG: hypothetical protein IT379_11090 [Deltaproteobacteria bacterium]|nr:hypothetical protein [Deltaproteobacteria bacterium]